VDHEVGSCEKVDVTLILRMDRSGLPRDSIAGVMLGVVARVGLVIGCVHQCYTAHFEPVA
jgi:hypothetical protein